MSAGRRISSATMPHTIPNFAEVPKVKESRAGRCRGKEEASGLCRQAGMLPAPFLAVLRGAVSRPTSHAATMQQPPHEDDDTDSDQHVEGCPDDLTMTCIVVSFLT